MTWLRGIVRKIQPVHVIYLLLVAVVFLLGFAVATPNMMVKRNLLTASVLAAVALVFVVTWYFSEKILAAGRAAELAHAEAEAGRAELATLRRQVAAFTAVYEADRHMEDRLLHLLDDSPRSA